MNKDEIREQIKKELESATFFKEFFLFDRKKPYFRQSLLDDVNNEIDDLNKEIKKDNPDINILKKYDNNKAS